MMEPRLSAAWQWHLQAALLLLDGVLKGDIEQMDPGC